MCWRMSPQWVGAGGCSAPGRASAARICATGIVFSRDWPTPDERLKGTAAILSRMAKLAEGSREPATLAR